VSDCELTERCTFLAESMARTPTIASFYRSQLCKGDFTSCARYVVYKAKGRKAVPADLLPDQMDRAKRILSERQSPTE
jgi:hypothetical protein